MIDMGVYLRGVLKGAPATRRRRLDEARLIQAAMQAQWGLSNPDRWRAKHLRWLLDTYLAQHSGHGRYQYWRTVTVIAQRRGRCEDWLPRLQGSWTTPIPSRPLGSGEMSL